MLTRVLNIAQSLVLMYMLQFMLGDVSQYQRLSEDFCHIGGELVATKISIIGIDNRSNLKYWKRSSKKFLSNAQPYKINNEIAPQFVITCFTSLICLFTEFISG
jgi:hypothetical protein